jgi:hypothetical protein
MTKIPAPEERASEKAEMRESEEKADASQTTKQNNKTTKRYRQ